MKYANVFRRFLVAKSWPVTRLGDVARIKHGFAFSGMTEGLSNDFPVVVGIGNFDYSGGFRFESTSLKRYSGEFPLDYELKPGDVLMAMTCQTPDGEILGVPGRIPHDGNRYLHNQRLGLLQVTDASKLDEAYFFQFARTKEFNRQLFATASGSKILHTSPGRMEDAIIPLPPIVEQRSIAATLDSLDKKIESNRRAVRLIVDLLTAQFESLVTDVPKSALSEFATIVLGGTPSRAVSEYWNTNDIPWINSGAANNDIISDPTDFISELGLNKSAAKLMPKGSTVIAITGATMGQVALLGLETAGNQSLVGIWGDSPELNSWLHFAIRYSISDLLDSSTGAAQQHVNKANVETLEVPFPDSGNLEFWGTFAVPSLDRAIQLKQEIRTLTAIRDSLLPELLSGRICVGEVEDQLEEALH